MINFTSKPRYDLSDLIRLVHVLRAPGGCPWDAAQTHLSIRRNFLEEAYEACEALDCECVQVIGRKFVLFKQKKKESAYAAVLAK